MSRAPLRRGEKGAVVPAADVRTYYDRPVIAEPAWTWEVPYYFWAGGLAGAAAVVTVAARVTGQAELARQARRVTALAAAVSPPLLIKDLGVPSRFLNMLRVFKPTSPLSVGSWVLSAFSSAAVGSAALAEIGRFPKLQRTAEAAAAALGPVMTTYTAVLVADTAVPVWHEARAALPAVFASSAAAAAGGAVTALTAPRDAAPARRLAVGAALAEVVLAKAMEQRLGEVGQPYRQGASGTFSKAAQAASLGGAGLLAVGGRRRVPARLAGMLLLVGSLLERWAVFRAGFQSARDPKYVVAPQRQRLTDAHEDR